MNPIDLKKGAQTGANEISQTFMKVHLRKESIKCVRSKNFKISLTESMHVKIGKESKEAQMHEIRIKSLQSALDANSPPATVGLPMLDVYHCNEMQEKIFALREEEIKSGLAKAKEIKELTALISKYQSENRILHEVINKIQNTCVLNDKKAIVVKAKQIAEEYGKKRLPLTGTLNDINENIKQLKSVSPHEIIRNQILKEELQLQAKYENTSDDNGTAVMQDVQLSEEESVNNLQMELDNKRAKQLENSKEIDLLKEDSKDIEEVFKSYIQKLNLSLDNDLDKILEQPHCDHYQQIPNVNLQPTKEFQQRLIEMDTEINTLQNENALVQTEIFQREESIGQVNLIIANKESQNVELLKLETVIKKKESQLQKQNLEMKTLTANTQNFDDELFAVKNDCDEIRAHIEEEKARSSATLHKYENVSTSLEVKHSRLLAAIEKANSIKALLIEKLTENQPPKSCLKSPKFSPGKRKVSFNSVVSERDITATESSQS